MRYLSRESIFTYKGNVLPLRLLGGEDYNTDKIRWSTDNKTVIQISEYSKNYRYGGEFTNGVLLTFLEVGEAVVTAKYGRKTYTCKIEVREMRRASSSDKLQYFVGDMHDHTANMHKLDAFAQRDPELYPKNHYMKQMKEDGRMDFAVVSDHSSCLCARDFFRGYADAEGFEESVVFFPGSEGQVTIRENDRYGVEHMHGGEILTFNADLAFTASSWEMFFQKLKTSPYAFCGYPHPQTIGSSVKGIWDFRHRENNSPAFKNLFRFVEMGSGNGMYSNTINEYIYSVALDEGFHVSPTCASDCHGPKWGYDIFPGKTVIMAPEKSKEAFHDAILNNRMYATSSGNVKLFYTVNEKAAPVTLENEGEYRFHVEIAYFRMGEPDTHIKKCKVITDRGITLMELKNMGDVFDFTVNAPDSHYFYLCLQDEENRKTWSCPVWTGKPFAKKKEKPLIPLAKEKLSVYDRISGQEIPTLVNDDPMDPWITEHGKADLIFDLGEEAEFSALSHYPYWVEHAMMTKKWVEDHLYIQRVPSKYRISTSRDGKTFERIAMGHFRIFGGEETIRFDKQKARYLRLEILSTAGKEWGRKDSVDSPLAMAEFTFWK
ncbi:MAG: discoidin domain-containing protein [Ruminococcaceae bacterium]|nr:discoidin domain-containing protein [Oscillospiraceae bacterium]